MMRLPHHHCAHVYRIKIDIMTGGERTGDHTTSHIRDECEPRQSRRKINTRCHSPSREPQTHVYIYTYWPSFGGLHLNKSPINNGETETRSPRTIRSTIPASRVRESLVRRRRMEDASAAHHIGRNQRGPICHRSECTQSVATYIHRTRFGKYIDGTR